MKRKLAKWLVLNLLAFAMMFTGCNDTSLAGAAATLDRIGSITVTAQTLVVNLNTQNVLTDDETRPLMAGFRRVGQVGLVAVGVVKNLQAQPGTAETDRAQIAAVLKAVQDAVSELTVSGAIGVKNPAVQKQIQQTIGQLVQLASNLVNAFIAEFGVSPDSVLAEVARA